MRSIPSGNSIPPHSGRKRNWNKPISSPASEAMPIAGMVEGELPYKTSEQDIPELYDFPSNLIDYLPKTR